MGNNRLKILNNLSIATPCSSDWDKMDSVAQGKFCQECNKNVFDTSLLSRAELAAILKENPKRCLRIVTRKASGQVIFRQSIARRFLNKIASIPFSVIGTLLISRSSFATSYSYRDDSVAETVDIVLVYLLGSWGATVMVLSLSVFLISLIFIALKKSKTSPLSA